MKAMVLKKQKTPLQLEEVPIPHFDADQILIKVHTCAICRTDLHIIDGELSEPKLPLILGHQIVGTVVDRGKNVQHFQKGDRVGVAWLAETCGKCEYCLSERENLCEIAKYTGYSLDGGFAQFTVQRAAYCFSLPSNMSDEEVAPLLCAGLIGYRAYKKAAPKKTLGLYGFGAAAHILTSIAQLEGKEIYAFTREGDEKTQQFARDLGAKWAGGSDSLPPELLDAAVLFAPVGALVPKSLRAIKKGGRCICGGIHMSDIPSFPYQDLWGEKKVESVSNLTRKDGKDFFSLISEIKVPVNTTIYPLERANEALEDLRFGKFQGSAVISL